jgi:hypothetical protein
LEVDFQSRASRFYRRGGPAIAEERWRSVEQVKFKRDVKNDDNSTEIRRGSSTPLRWSGLFLDWINAQWHSEHALRQRYEDTLSAKLGRPDPSYHLSVSRRSDWSNRSCTVRMASQTTSTAATTVPDRDNTEGHRTCGTSARKGSACPGFEMQVLWR